MIVFLLISLLLAVLTLFSDILPPADVLPFGIDPIVLNAMNGYRALAEVFFPLEIVLQAFLVYLLFRLGMLLVKLFMGSRAPDLN